MSSSRARGFAMHVIYHNGIRLTAADEAGARYRRVPSFSV